MRRAFVIGHPIAHSRSPKIHTHWLNRHGLAGSYEAVEVLPGDLGLFVKRLRADGSFVGGNVTIPHKELALDLADRPDAIAGELGAANTLWIEDGRICATNTDGYGFLANLDERATGWDRTGEDRRVAVVLGAGGASRAVIWALASRGFDEIRLVNRTVERAEGLAEHFGERVRAMPLDRLGEAVEGASLFVNTSAMGMDGTEVPAVNFATMPPDATVTDIVYTPLMTPLLAAAERAGLRTVDGLGMLLHQAVPGFEKWFGVRPEVTAELRRVILADLGVRE